MSEDIVLSLEFTKPHGWFSDSDLDMAVARGVAEVHHQFFTDYRVFAINSTHGSTYGRKMMKGHLVAKGICVAEGR